MSSARDIELVDFSLKLECLEFLTKVDLDRTPVVINDWGSNIITSPLQQRILQLLSPFFHCNHPCFVVIL